MSTCVIILIYCIKQNIVIYQPSVQLNPFHPFLHPPVHSPVVWSQDDVKQFVEQFRTHPFPWKPELHAVKGMFLLLGRLLFK